MKRNSIADIVVFPEPLSPTTATVCPGMSSRSTSMTAAGADESAFGQPPARRNEIGQMFARFDRRTVMGSIAGTGVSISPRTRSPLCRERLYASADAGRAATASKAASGINTTTASITPLIAPSRTADVPRERAPQTASAGTDDGEARSDTCGQRRRPRDACQTRIECRQLGQVLRSGTVGDEVGPPIQQRDDTRRQFRSCFGQPGLGAPVGPRSRGRRRHRLRWRAIQPGQRPRRGARLRRHR